MFFPCYSKWESSQESESEALSASKHPSFAISNILQDADMY